MTEPTRRPRVFVDVETTGLSLTRHQIVELAYAVEAEPVQAAVLPHGLEEAERAALEVNRYYERGLDDPTRWDLKVLPRFMRAAFGATLVGANVSFDAYRLEKLAEHSTWHHRMVDLESAAMLILGMAAPPGLHTIQDTLTGLGFDIPAPDHTAGGDVETVRACLAALERIAAHLLRNGLPTAEQLGEAVAAT